VNWRPLIEFVVSVGYGVLSSVSRSRTVQRLRERRERPRKPAGRVRTRLRAWSDRLLGLLGDHRWGIPIVFLSACLAIPPLYPVTLAVPATRMSVIPFGLAVFLGRMVLFLAIAFGVSALID
jgi:membrane protein YqaA with SNARE-associated domain